MIMNDGNTKKTDVIYLMVSLKRMRKITKYLENGMQQSRHSNHVTFQIKDLYINLLEEVF